MQRIVTGSRQALEEMYLPLLRGPAPGARRGGTSVGWHEFGAVQVWGCMIVQWYKGGAHKGGATHWGWSRV